MLSIIGDSLTISFLMLLYIFSCIFCYSFIDLWMDWLKDEIKLVSSSEDRAKVEDLFDKAFQDYQCEYLLFILTLLFGFLCCCLYRIHVSIHNAVHIFFMHLLHNLFKSSKITLNGSKLNQFFKCYMVATYSKSCFCITNTRKKVYFSRFAVCVNIKLDTFSRFLVKIQIDTLLYDLFEIVFFFIKKAYFLLKSSWDNE